MLGRETGLSRQDGFEGHDPGQNRQGNRHLSGASVYSVTQRNGELVPWAQHVTLVANCCYRCPMTEAEPEAKGTAWKRKMIHFVVGFPPASGYDQQPGTTAVSWPVTECLFVIELVAPRKDPEWWSSPWAPLSFQSLSSIWIMTNLLSRLLAPLGTVHLPQTTPTSRSTHDPLSAAAKHLRAVL